ncbi:ABC transporter substrate-binding protein [Lapillicoccus jejuensis]|uniref:Osmoprotectant transport system substrate-binding protein n=1 Tax=Lapillicoccus jejuensis TaxID=402171 RepID=A0A542DYI7_9MICO|nr:ABC transporter substrate-binding protein [Lapillicoccus jejuensis]TQJ08106.1 osmoprotectant transport system substrate-binding protein [Lapillicoccus jejuensis]
MKTTTTGAVALALASALALSACGSDSSGGDPLSGGGDSASKAPSDTIVVGSANFPESELIMDIYAGALKAKGVKVSTKPNIGSRETYIPALQDGSIDLVPEYTGVLDQYFNKSAKATTSDEVYTELKSSLPSTLEVLDKSAAEDKDGVVVSSDTASKYNLKSIADLAPVAKDLVLGGPPEWKTRETGVPGLKKVYGLEFKEFKSLDAGGPLTVNALKNGQIQAANLFTTDPNIPANNFVVLEDPKSLFAAQNVVPLITKSKSSDTVSSALNAVSAKLDTTTLASLVKEVVIDKKDASAVAQEFLSKNSLG